MSEQKKRNIVIGVLCGVLLLMVVGYAAFSTLLNIEGTTSITSNWDIKITGITSKGIVGDASDAGSQVVDDLSATFKANLVSPGDSISYDITIENNGNLNAELDSISMSENTNKNILIETSGVQEGDKLNAGSNATLTVKITYSDEVTSQPDNLKAEVTITLDYVQEGMRVPPTTDFETESTTRAITVTVPKIEGATKYEFRKDSDSWVSNEDPTNNVYTFDQITHNTEHDIQVKVTKGSKVIESEVKQARTNILPTPSVSASGSTANMTFPSGCTDGTYTCSYTRNQGQCGTYSYPVTSTSASEYMGSGCDMLLTLYVSDGYNTTNASKSFSGVCFVAGTKVWTEKGKLNIEDLKIGDKVYSYNEKTKKVELKEIKYLYVRETNKIVILNYTAVNKLQLIPNQIKNIVEKYNLSNVQNNNEIKCTEEHPYYVIGKGWIEAGDLKIGDKVLTANNKEVMITNTQKTVVKSTKVYNLSVDDNQNYYVGSDGLLVHNYTVY